MKEVKEIKIKSNQTREEENEAVERFLAGLPAAGNNRTKDAEERKTLHVPEGKNRKSAEWEAV